MKFKFGYTGSRVRNLQKAVEFFTDVLGMTVEARVPSPATKGEFVNLRSPGGKHWLEVNWYAEDSPAAGPWREGEELDHLGFQVDNFPEAIKRLKDAGYPPVIGPFKAGEWTVAFVKGVEGIWLDVYHIARKRPKRKRPAKKPASRKRRR